MGSARRTVPPGRGLELYDSTTVAIPRAIRRGVPNMSDDKPTKTEPVKTETRPKTAGLFEKSNKDGAAIDKGEVVMETKPVK